MPEPNKPEKDNPNKMPLTLQEKREWLRKRALRRKRIEAMRQATLEEDNDDMVQGLSPSQLQQLAQRVVDLWRAELHLEDERFGRNNFR
jgi:hypothetical protein